MKSVKGFWLPDTEEHMVPFLNDGFTFARGPTYQGHKWLRALQYVKNFNHFVDVGAHCGLWARPMAAIFSKVTAFEPLVQHRQCFDRNVIEGMQSAHVTLYPFALGEKDEELRMRSDPHSTGDSAISPDGETIVPVRRLDDFPMPKIDFLKIDCEGFEVFALRGGETTIRRDKPLVIVEQKTKNGNKFGEDPLAAVKLLKAWGATQHFEISGDFCMGW
jgi:FkbM family methyltransferase